MEIPTYFLIILFSGLLTYFVQKIFIHYNLFDGFNNRSSHKTLATRNGGISVFLTLFSFSIYFYSISIEIFDYTLFIPLGIMFIIGVYDDLYNADFKLKFLLQIIAAKIIIDMGFVITNYHGLFGLNEVSWILAQLTTIFVFLVIVNSINFIDGIDGLAITEVIKSIMLIELFSASPTALSKLGIMVILILITLYYFNFKKNKKVFLGDGGSLVLGTIMAVYIFYILGVEYQFKEGYQVNKTLFAVLVILFPLVDLLRVFVLRIKDGKSPFTADQNHIHHLLLKRKLNPMTSILIIQIISLLASALIIIYNIFF